MSSGASPTGTVTFLFTDIEGSTQLWDTLPVAMASALEHHDFILNRAIADGRGTVFATGGDGFCVAFHSARQAVDAAISAQRELASHTWPVGCAIRVRMGLHSGEAVERAGDYFGPSVNLAARVMSAAHGGQIVCTDIVAELAAGTATTQPLGEHQLKGVSTAIRINQVIASCLQTAFGALRTLESVPTNLPSELVPPVGRAETISEIVDLAGRGRLITLTGVGGVGKTTVALSVGRQLLDGAKQGVWLVELAAVAEPPHVLEAVAAALRFTPPSGVPLQTSLAEFLERRDLVLVLDNCEHLLDAVAEVAHSLLSSCPSLRMLATSREAIRIPAEQVVAILPLRVPDGDSPAAVMASSAGELFCVRAQAAGAAWRLDQEHAPAVGRLCRRLDGIPLALELAASRSAQLSIPNIVTRLEQRLDLLARPRRSGDARHQTLVAALEWSYELLEDAEQRLLRQLSTFADGFDIGAASLRSPNRSTLTSGPRWTRSARWLRSP